MKLAHATLMTPGCSCGTSWMDVGFAKRSMATHSDTGTTSPITRAVVLDSRVDTLGLPSAVARHRATLFIVRIIHNHVPASLSRRRKTSGLG